MIQLVLYLKSPQANYQAVSRVAFPSGSSGGDTPKYIQVIHRIQVHAVVMD